MRRWIGFAVPVLMLVDAAAYSLGAIGPIERGLNAAEPYWQKRLRLNLMLANEGMYLGAAVPLIGAIVDRRQRGTARTLFGLTLANCVYTLVTVPLFTRRDSAHMIPRALAAMLIVIGFALPSRPESAPGPTSTLAPQPE